MSFVRQLQKLGNQSGRALLLDRSLAPLLSFGYWVDVVRDDPVYVEHICLQDSGKTRHRLLGML